MTSANTARSILIVSGCSATKRVPPPETFGFEELASADTRRRLMDLYPGSRLPARDLYRGRHHRRVLGALDAWRCAAPELRIELAIVSAGYGLLAEHEKVISYDATFDGLPPAELLRRSRLLGIPTGLRHRLAGFDAAIVLLGEAYLAAAEAPFGVCAQEIYLASPGFAPGPGVLHIDCGRATAKALGVMAGEARAAVFERFVVAVQSLGWDEAVSLARSASLPLVSPVVFQAALE